MGKEHQGIKSIWRNYEDWELNTLEPHEVYGHSNRKTSILLGMFMYIDREYHHWLHNTSDGREENKELQQEMKVKCMEYHNMSESDFDDIFIRGYSHIRDKYL